MSTVHNTIIVLTVTISGRAFKSNPLLLPRSKNYWSILLGPWRAKSILKKKVLLRIKKQQLIFFMSCTFMYFQQHMQYFWLTLLKVIYSCIIWSFLQTLCSASLKVSKLQRTGGAEGHKAATLITAQCTNTGQRLTNWLWSCK